MAMRGVLGRNYANGSIRRRILVDSGNYYRFFCNIADL